MAHKCLETGCIDLRDMKFPDGCAKISAHKEPNSYEIACSLFERCNLRCKFCFQEHATDIDLDVIQKLPLEAWNASWSDLHEYPTIKRIHLLFIGGELFSDDIDDSVFNAYRRMFQWFDDLFTTTYPDKELDISVCTNGVWKRRDRVVSLFHDIGVNHVVVSYDPAGRYPTKSVEKTVRKNIVFLHHSGFTPTISFVLSKPNIREYITRRRYLKYMKSPYIKYGDMNWYIGNPGWGNDLPSDDEVFEFYKWALDNHLYKIHFLKLMMEAMIHKEKYINSPNDRQCDCKYLLGMSGLKPTKNCIERYSFFENKLFYGTHSEGLTEENVSDVKASLGIQKRGCLNCKYYNMCPMPCWSSVLFKEFKPTKCPVERAFDYITDEHIDQYKKFVEENA